VVAALAHTLHNELTGVYNVAADGVLALSEVAGLLGKSYAPVLPPWGTGLAAAALRRLGLRVPQEMLGQLRFGRGLDNRKLKATGFHYRYTTRETVIKLAEHLRISPILRGVSEPYRYEREVEEFLRWSPHVRNPAYREAGPLTPRQAFAMQKLMAGAPDGAPVPSYDELEPEEIVALLGSLEPDDLHELLAYERAARARGAVIAALEDVLARQPAPEEG
jgi:UDP-glucose 4-epimerase